MCQESTCKGTIALRAMFGKLAAGQAQGGIKAQQ